jgi:hypothetical protein
MFILPLIFFVEDRINARESPAWTQTGSLIPVPMTWKLQYVAISRVIATATGTATERRTAQVRPHQDVRDPDSRESVSIHRHRINMAL